MVRKRRLPVVGDGGGVFSFVHVEDAAAVTVRALDNGSPGAYNVVDDDPAPVREWLPVYAEALGAKRPRHVPVFLARWIGGEYGVRVMTQTEGASNRKAKAELGMQLRYPSWRRGFMEALG
jgi:nucleoside-diphosphate-sugar epimerase